MSFGSQLLDLLFGCGAAWICTLCGETHTTPRTRTPQAPRHCGKLMIELIPP